MEDARPGSGKHMSRETLLAALEWTARAEYLSRSLLNYDTLLFSGGECTEHPEFLEFLELAEGRGFFPLIISYGGFLRDPDLTARILRPGRRIAVQVTYDPRFYRKGEPPKSTDPRVKYVTGVSRILPIGRAQGNPIPAGMEMIAPGSFNFRALTHQLGSIEAAVFGLRQRVLQGKAGNCTPSIDWEGNVLAGESAFCYRIGTVWEPMSTLYQRVLAMGECNRCGLEDKLQSQYREVLKLPPKKEST